MNMAQGLGFDDAASSWHARAKSWHLVLGRIKAQRSGTRVGGGSKIGLNFWLHDPDATSHVFRAVYK